MKYSDSTDPAALPTSREQAALSWALKWMIVGTRGFLWVITLASATLLFYKSVTTDPGVNTNTASKVEDLVYGNAWKPLINRLLVPVTARVLIFPLPKEVRERWSVQLMEMPLVQHAFQSPHWNDKFVLEYTVVLGLMYICFIGFLLAIRWLFVTVFVAHPLVADMAPLLCLFLLRPLMWPTTYPYDFATLLFSTLLMISMARGAWRGYALVFLLATLNKETSIVFILFFIYYFRFAMPMRRPLYYRLIAWQMTCWGAVKVITSILYQNNGGENFWAIKNWSGHNPEVFMSYFPMSTFGAYLILIAACIYQWKSKPLLFRQLFLWLMWILIPLHICIAWIDELRSFYDAIPAAVILMAHSLSAWTGNPLPQADYWGRLPVCADAP